MKSLGVGLGAGTRRNSKVIKQRLKAFLKRLPRFQRLRMAGVGTARLLRTGGIAAITYGQAIAGVQPSMLLQQRRAAASAVAFAGMAEQSLDFGPHDRG